MVFKIVPELFSNNKGGQIRVHIIRLKSKNVRFLGKSGLPSVTAKKPPSFGSGNVLSWEKNKNHGQKGNGFESGCTDPPLKMPCGSLHTVYSAHVRRAVKEGIWQAGRKPCS
jgi:hypothetical protein